MTGGPDLGGFWGRGEIGAVLSMGIESGPDFILFWSWQRTLCNYTVILWCAPCPNFKDKASPCTPLWLGELHYVLVLRLKH